MNTNVVNDEHLANGTLKIPDASIVPHLLLFLVQILALASPPYRGLRIGFIFIITILAVYCNLHRHFTNNFDLAQPASLAWSTYLPTIAKLCVSEGKNTESRFWRIDRQPAEAVGYAAFGAKKTWWALVLMFNQRGLGTELRKLRQLTKDTPILGTRSSYTTLYIAFFISGTFHALGLLYLPRPANIGDWECSSGLFKFFILQAVAITFEDFMIWCGRHVIGSRLQRLARLLGYVWVFFFMWWSLQLVGDSVLKLRIGEGAFSPFPLMRPFVRAYISIPPV
ncbi:hypothetical protein EKO27_g5289 [Xylaria grammica]|uniref:Wax synthase domain-containing protein n=1 Tax=Xylaria grammica TaxID=363999 RepID=A0A439D5X3_9PEZI|nr:hypothetical protein EKO27_g5289 [Xylaria grammica]